MCIHRWGDRSGGHGFLRDAEEGTAERCGGGAEVDQRGDDLVSFSVCAVSETGESAEEKKNGGRGDGSDVHGVN